MIIKLFLFRKDKLLKKIICVFEKERLDLSDLYLTLLFHVWQKPYYISSTMEIDE